MIEADLKKEEVKVEVEVEDDECSRSAERERELRKEEKRETWHRVYRPSGKFRRRLRLPENAKVEEIKASMANGVLIVKAIEISG